MQPIPLNPEVTLPKQTGSVAELVLVEDGVSYLPITGTPTGRPRGPPSSGWARTWTPPGPLTLLGPSLPQRTGRFVPGRPGPPVFNYSNRFLRDSVSPGGVGGGLVPVGPGRLR